MGIAGCHRDDLRYYPISSGWHNIIWTLSHPDEITMLIPKSSGWLSYRQYLIRMTYGYCRMSPGWLTFCPISSGWHNVIWTLSHPDELAPGRISSGWLLDTAVCHPDDISYHHMSSGWLSRNQYQIRMSYDTVIMSSGWHTLPFLSHPGEIAIFDFPQHAVALQRFRTLGVAMKAAKHLVTSIIWHVCGEFVNNVFINWEFLACLCTWAEVIILCHLSVVRGIYFNETTNFLVELRTGVGNVLWRMQANLLPDMILVN